MSAAAPASTRERLLQAAETLFAERGFEATTLRELSTLAGGNLAAIHYHFGSKEALLESIFAARAAPIAERRLALLAACPRNEAGQLALEDIIEAFLRPGWELGTDAGQSPPFMRLRARIAIEQKDVMRTMLSRAFDASSRRFIEELAIALPTLPRSELYWRFHFLLGVMNYSMANPGRIQSLTDDACDPGDLREMLPRAVAFAALGFRGPPTTG